MKLKMTMLLLCSMVISLQAQQINPYQLDTLLKGKIKGMSPGFAIGVVQNGNVIYERYQGYSNLEDAISIDESSKFNIASCAKQFTAISILKLVQEQKLRLEDDFRKYLPEFYPNITTSITIKDLITHTSGVRDYSDLLSIQGRPWWQRVGLDNKDVLELLAAQKTLNFTPGTEEIYSNSGYILLTKVVEKVSGMPFHQYARNVFESLGMNDTAYTTNYMEVLPHKSLPYNDWGDGVWQQYPMVVDVHGDGFLFTTLRDQLRWEQQLQQAAESEGSVLLKASQMPVPNNNTPDYGYGVEFNTFKEYSVLEHAGGTGSYNAHFLRFPSEQLSIVVMSNNGNFWSTGTAYEIANAILGISEETPNSEMKIPTATSATPKKEELIGTYVLEPDNTVISIVLKDNELYREIYDRAPVKLLAEKGNMYRYETFPELKMVFVKNDQGVYDFQLYQPGVDMRRAARLQEDEISSNYYSSLNGTYLSEELGTSFTLRHIKGNDFSIVRDGDEFDARLIVKNYLQAGDYILRVEQDMFGRVVRIPLDYGRNKDIQFDRSELAGFQTLVRTEDGGTITTGTTSESYGMGKGDILLSKSAPDGNEEWFKTFGGKSYEKAGSVHLTRDKGYLIIGSTSSYGNGNYDVYVVKTDSNGNKIWEHTYGDFYNEYGLTMEETPDGYLLKGSKQKCSSNTDVFNRKCEDFHWTITIDSKGNELSNEVLDPINRM